jgi:hypothetical protein
MRVCHCVVRASRPPPTTCLGLRLCDTSAPLAPAHARALLLLLVCLQVLAAALAVLQVQVSYYRSTTFRQASHRYPCLHVPSCLFSLIGRIRKCCAVPTILEQILVSVQALTMSTQALTTANQAVVAQATATEVAFTSLTSKRLVRLLAGARIREGMYLGALHAVMEDARQPVATLEWRKDRNEEWHMSRAMKVLRQNTRVDAVDISHGPLLSLHVEDLAGRLTSSGRSDAALVLPNAVGDDTVSVALGGASVYVELKTPLALSTARGIKKHSTQGKAEALAFCRGGRDGPPVVVTNMSTMALFFIVVDGEMHALHPKDGFLPMHIAAAWMRYFMANGGRLNDVDAEALIRAARVVRMPPVEEGGTDIEGGSSDGEKGGGGAIGGAAATTPPPVARGKAALRGGRGRRQRRRRRAARRRSRLTARRGSLPARRCCTVMLPRQTSGGSTTRWCRHTWGTWRANAPRTENVPHNCVHCK